MLTQRSYAESGSYRWLKPSRTAAITNSWMVIRLFIWSGFNSGKHKLSLINNCKMTAVIVRADMSRISEIALPIFPNLHSALCYLIIIKLIYEEQFSHTSYIHPSFHYHSIEWLCVWWKGLLTDPEFAVMVAITGWANSTIIPSCREPTKPTDICKSYFMCFWCFKHIACKIV